MNAIERANVFWSQDSTAWLAVINDFAPKADSDRLLSQSLWLPLIERPKVRLFGRLIPMPRSVGFFSDEVQEYWYSGQASRALQMPHWLSDFVAYVSRIGLGCDGLNACLVNRYDGGNDSISPHSDDESRLVRGASVAFMSLGQERIMRFSRRPRGAGLGQIPSLLNLHHGQLVVMGGTFQSQLLHSVPKQRDVTGTRISLTLRNHAIGTRLANAT